MSKTQKSKPPKGRAANGSPVAVGRGHVRLNILLEPTRKARLAALSTMMGKSAGVIVGEALDAYISHLPAEDRRLVESLAQRSQRVKKVVSPPSAPA